MSQKEARGTKRTCLSCESRFYDLNNDPIVCPLCQAPYVMTAIDTAAAAAEAAAVAARPKPIKPPVKEKVFAPAEPADGEELPDMESTEALAEIEAEDTEIADDETADDTFLEEEEGEGSDVAGLVEGPVEGEEET